MTDESLQQNSFFNVSELLEGPDTAVIGELNKFSNILCIVKFLIAVAERKMLGLISANEVEQYISAASLNTSLSINALREDFHAIERTLRLCQGRALEQQIAFAVLEEKFQHGSTLWRDPDTGLWEFDGRSWCQITKERLLQVVTDVWQEDGEFAQLFTPLLAKKTVDVILVAALRTLSITDVAAESDGVLLNVMNGELWLSGNKIELRPHRPWSGQLMNSVVEYDEMATCAGYDKALGAIFAKSTDPMGMARHWNEVLGYAVQPTRKIASFWLLIGHGANGKSKLLEILQKIVGADAVLSEPISRFQKDNFALASLSGKRVLIDDDVDEDLILGDGLIKKLSEEKLFTGRSPYGRMKKVIRSIALPMMAGNHYPTTRDVSPGMKRRTFVIPFERIFEANDQQPELFNVIWKEEQAGILNAALAGFIRIVDRGYKFDEPKDCIEYRQRFFEESNPLRAFLKERCDVGPNQKTRISTIRAAFVEWAKGNSISKLSAAGNKLKRNLELMGYTVSDMKGYPYVVGLVLKKTDYD